MKILVFDVETTGLDLERDRIVEFAAVVIDEAGKEIYTNSAVVNPLIQMSAENVRIHGITNQEARKGRSWADYAEKMVVPLFERVDVVAGHNILGFDIPILRSNLERVGLKMPKVHACDTLVAARRFFHFKKYNLAAVGSHFDVTISRAHRALPDTQANAKVLCAMAKKLGLTLEEFTAPDCICYGSEHVEDPFVHMIQGYRTSGRYY